MLSPRKGDNTFVIARQMRSVSGGGPGGGRRFDSLIRESNLRVTARADVRYKDYPSVCARARARARAHTARDSGVERKQFENRIILLQEELF